MPVTYAKAPSAATRYPPASQTEPAVASKKKKKKKGKGKAHDGSNPSNHMNHVDHDGIDDDEDDLGQANPAENELNGRRTLDGDYSDLANYPNSQTAPLNAASHGQPPLRMSTTATAQAELLAAANELYKRMETEQMANDTSDGEYWKQLPSHIRSFVETTYAHGAALSPNERSKSQAMLALAQTMVDEATSRFPTGGFPPPFDPSLLSDPKFAERLGMKHGGIGAMNLMREYADEAYDDYNSENDEDDIDDEQQYEADDSSKKKKKKKKRGVAATVTNGTTPHPNPLPPIIPLAPNQAATVTRAAPSAAQPRPSSRAAGKQPVYSQPTVPPARTTRSAATKSPVPPNPYNHGYAKSAVANGTSTLTKRPTGGGGDKDGRSKLWSSSTEQDRERIKEFWLGLSDVERRDLVKLEKEAVLKKMKEQQKHSCSCAVCGRKRNAIEEELEVLYDAYYEELEQYANHQQQYQSSGGKITPPPGPGPFPGSVAVDKNGAVIGGPPGATKHPARGGRPAINGARGRKVPPDSEDEYEDEYDDDEDEYDDEEEEEEEEEEDDDDDGSNTRKVVPRRRDLPPRAPLSRRPNGREDFFNFGNLTTAGPGNILTVADDLLKNDGGKFLEMMEQLAERRMQREEDAAKEVEVDSEEDEDDPEGSEEDEEDDEDNDDESEEEDDDPMSEEQKMEEGRKMFSIFAARMFEQRVLNAYREKVAAERQEQLLRELEDEDKIQAEKDAKRQKENQKKKDKKKQQKQVKEAEKAKKDAEKANEEAARRAELEAHEEEIRKRRDEERLKRESERKQKEEEKAKAAEERRQRIAEQKAIEAERKREKEERERKERLARQEKEAQAKAEKAERDRKAKEERATREAKEREEREKREKEDKERKERDRLEQAKVEERKKQEALAAAATAKAKATPTPTSPRASNYPPGPAIQQAKKPVNNIGVKQNGPLSPSQRPIANSMNRPPQMQQPPQPILVSSQRPMMGQGQGMPINLQLPPNMGIAPLGMAQSFNSMVSPIAMSPRIGYGPPSATGVGHGPFSPLAPFAQGQGQPGMMNGSIIGNMQQYSFDAQSPLMPQPQPAGAMTLQPSRPSSTLPPTLTMPPPKAPGTPTTNGIPPIGVSPGGSSSAAAVAAHIRRASAQANPSPFGAIGKPRGAPSSIVGDDDRGLGGLPIMSPPSPDRVLGSSALVDENDTIVELPKRRSTSGRIDTIGAPAAVGSRWSSRGTASWPAPNGPGPVGMQWSAAPGRPQPNRLDSPFSPS